MGRRRSSCTRICVGRGSGTCTTRTTSGSVPTARCARSSRRQRGPPCASTRPTVETYREPSISRHPWFGRLGPDLTTVDADLDRCVELLLVLRRPAGADRRGAPRPACVRRPRQRLPQRSAVGLRAAPVLRRRRHRRGPRPAHRQRRRATPPSEPLQRRAGGDARRSRRARRLRAHRPRVLPLRRHRRAARTGGHDRVLYWCPGCQTRHAPVAAPAAADLPTDQHPAAKAFRDDDTPWLITG